MYRVKSQISDFQGLSDQVNIEFLVLVLYCPVFR